MVRSTRSPRANEVSSAASSGGRSRAVDKRGPQAAGHGRRSIGVEPETAAACLGDTAVVRITAIRLQRLVVPLEPPFAAAWDPEPRRTFPVTIVRVETDEGVIGIGSGDTMDGFEAYEHLFVGQDPLAIARHVRVLETIDFHAGRYWPLEAALWDIAGQVAGLPVADAVRRRDRRHPGLRLVRDAAAGRGPCRVRAAPPRGRVPRPEDPGRSAAPGRRARRGRRDPPRRG